MITYNSEAIILRSRKFSEADALLTLCSRNHGKISAIAKGVRKPKSTKRGGVQLFTHGVYSLRRGRNMDQIDQCTITSSFGKLWGDLDRLSYATYVTELVDGFMLAGERNEELFLLLLTTLHLMEVHDPMLVALIFQIRLMQIMGYHPQLDTCVQCNQPIHQVYNRFSAQLGGVLCPNCTNRDPFAINCHQGHLATIRQMAKINLAKLGILKISPDYLRELEKIFRSYVGFHLEKRVKSWDFINSVQGAPAPGNKESRGVQPNGESGENRCDSSTDECELSSS